MNLNNGQSEYSSISLNEWILAGCWFHISVALCMCSVCCLFCCIFVKTGDLMGNIYTRWIAICFCCTLSFFVAAWVVIGFLMFSEMSSEGQQCKDAMLAWLIIKIIESAICFLT